jgi:mono/diheme cytochrome c family protein
MTKTLVWIIIFIGAFAALFLLQHLTKNSSSEGSGSSSGENAGSDEGKSGKQLFSDFKCANCHGSNFSGSPMGPALIDLKKNYTVESLITYLRDPAKNNSGARFEEYKSKFSSRRMPSFGDKNNNDLLILSQYLLSK